MSYAEFLRGKANVAPTIGAPCQPGDVNPMLHPWQRQIVAWAVAKGRAAVWADTGLGKTFMQLEWARLSGDRTMIVAPLAVCQQTIGEAARLGIDLRYVKSDDDGPWPRITNYERVPALDVTRMDAIVLDESSILKHHDAKTRQRLINAFRHVPRRLACSATPAPNDPEELTGQAEFLGIMSRQEMLAAYFVHDSDDGWRLKGHAATPMYRWMSTWAVALKRPSDLGYPDDGYILPPLDVIRHLVETTGLVPEGQLFALDPGGVQGRAKVRRATIEQRVEHAVRIVQSDSGQSWVLWCGLNDEAALAASRIAGSVNVRGSWDPESKADAYLRFARGDIPVLITKPSMASFGMNWQHCARMIFVGLSDSYESYYQCIRRCYRYGQKRPVRAHVVLSDAERQIALNIMRKERQAESQTRALVESITHSKEVGTPC